MQMDRMKMWQNDDWYIFCFQSDVMHLTEDSTRLKLFMDVLDGAKAAVSHHGITYFLVIYVVSFLVLLFYFSSFYRCFHPNSFCLFQLTTPMSVPCLRLGSMMATLLLVLLKQWRRSEFTHLTESFEVCSEHLTYPNFFVSYKLLSSRHQCGSNSSWHPVSPLPDPGECPASWPADDGEDQSQNLLCTHFCAADSGTQR